MAAKRFRQDADQGEWSRDDAGGAASARPAGASHVRRAAAGLDHVPHARSAAHARHAAPGTYGHAAASGGRVAVSVGSRTAVGGDRRAADGEARAADSASSRGVAAPAPRSAAARPYATEPASSRSTTDAWGADDARRRVAPSVSPHAAAPAARPAAPAPRARRHGSRFADASRATAGRHGFAQLGATQQFEALPGDIPTLTSGDGLGASYATDDAPRPIGVDPAVTGAFHTIGSGQGAVLTTRETAAEGAEAASEAISDLDISRPLPRVDVDAERVAGGRGAASRGAGAARGGRSEASAGARDGVGRAVANPYRRRGGARRVTVPGRGVVSLRDAHGKLTSIALAIAVAVLAVVVLVWVLVLLAMSPAQDAPAAAATTEAAPSEAVASTGQTVQLNSYTYGLGQQADGTWAVERKSGDDMVPEFGLAGTPVSLVMWQGSIYVPENLPDGTWDVISRAVVDGAVAGQLEDADGNPYTGEGTIVSAELDGSSLVLTDDAGSQTTIPLAS